MGLFGGTIIIANVSQTFPQSLGQYSRPRPSLSFKVGYLPIFVLISFCGITHQMISHSLVSGKYYIQSSSGATARVVLLDFRKAFDLIDHSILVQKLTKYDIPSQVKGWIVDFLMDRKQRVKLAQDCHSEWRSVPSGVPQGTKLGPWLFLVMINELDTPFDMWKYVDDTSCSEIVTKGSESKLQEAVDDLSRQASLDGFQLNEAKCKELRIGFPNSNHDFEPLVLNGKPRELVTRAKLLFLAMSIRCRYFLISSLSLYF